MSGKSALTGEIGQVRERARIDRRARVADVAETQLVSSLPCVVRADQPGAIVLVRRYIDRQYPDRNLSAQNRRCALGSRSRRHVALQDSQIRARKSLDAFQGGETLGRWRREGTARGGGQSDRVHLERTEVEEPVPDDGTADRAPEAIVVQARVLMNASSFVGLVDRIQMTIREVLVQGTVDLVGPALDDRVELPASGAAEFRAVLILQQGELGHCLVGHIDDPPGDALVVVVDPLDHEVVVSGPLAADRRTFAQAGTPARSDSGALQREVQHSESQVGTRAVERLPDIERLPHRRGCRVDLRRGCGDLDCRLNLTQLEADVGGGRAIEGDGNSGKHRRSEAFRRGGQRVLPDREIVEAVGAAFVGLLVPLHAGVDVLDRHGAARNRCTGLVENGSDEVSVRRLTEGSVGHAQEDCHCRNCMEPLSHRVFLITVKSSGVGTFPPA